jgi:predicted nucleic acid-binding Zn ribbon protein
MKTSKKPEAVGGILDRLLKSLEIDKKVDEGKAMVLWPQAVGPKVAASTRPVSVIRGRMTVHAKSSVWVQECMFLKSKIRDKLNQELGGEIIKEIVFKVGDVQ